MNALRAGQFTDLAVLAETQRHLDALWKDQARAEKLLVPDGSRRIFDAPEKRNWQGLLSKEIDELLSNVYMEIESGRRSPNQTLDVKRSLVQATAI